MPAETVAFLREHGPSVKADLPAAPTLAQRRDGLSLFRVNGARGPSSNVEHLHPICYLPEHDPETVIRAFCDVHPQFVAAKSKEAFVRIIGQQGRAWRAAASRVADDLELELHSSPGGSYADSDPVTCPACGQEVEKRLPYHLRGDCPKT